MIRSQEIRIISKKHAAAIRVGPKEPDYHHRGEKHKEELLAYAAFLFRNASNLASKGLLLRAIHTFGFAEALLWIAGTHSIADLKKLRPSDRGGSRTGVRALLRRTCYRIGDWFFECADQL